jgi:hypothetical protein
MTQGEPDRAAVTFAAWQELEQRPYARRTRSGPVVIERVEHHTAEGGATWVEVWVGNPEGGEAVGQHGGVQQAKRQRRTRG